MERERTRVREKGSFTENYYERFLRSRADFVKRQSSGQIVVKSSDRETHLTRQGRITYLLDRLSFPDTPLQDWLVFKHDLRTRSGKHRHQGGLVIFVITGVGYSVVDGERVDWKAGDLLLLPMKPDGVEHQHFNLNPSLPCEWIAFVHMPIYDHLAAEITQGEVSPEFADANRT
jgi:hypothetical protein